MSPIEIVSTLTPADWRAYQVAWATRLQQTNRSSRFGFKALLVIGLVSLALATVLSMWLRAADGQVQVVSFVLGAALTLTTLIVAQRRLQHTAAPDLEGTILGQCTMRFDEAGIQVVKPRASSHYHWSALQSTTVTTEHLFLWVDRVAGLIVPLRDLPRDFTPAQLTELMDSCRPTTSEQQPSIAPSSSFAKTELANESDVSTTTSWGDFARACVRLWTFRTVDAGALNLPDRILATVVAGCVAVMIGTDWALTDDNRQFEIYGVLTCTWYAIAILFIGWVAARASEPDVPFKRVAALIAAFLPIIVMARLLLSLSDSDSSWLLGVFVVAFYGILILERGLRSITLRAQPRVIAVSMLIAALILALSQQFYVSTQLFYSDYESDGDASAGERFLEHRRAAEATLFAQAQRIQDAVEAFDITDDSRPNTFFVGFAGMGEQRVFAGEIALAERAIGAKFGTNARSIALVNDRRDLDSHPLASPTSLRYTLAAIAEKMNLDRDVLFLSLSSHGGANGELSVSNWGLPLNNLSADELAAALKASGIKWRVVVVSACYAGTFIEPLRDDNTIVIAAAAPDRTSFGCSDDRDLTYFGEAFYRDSVLQSANLRTAFENAKTLIAEREAQEEIEQSNPQAHFGSAIEAHLAEIGTR